MSQTRTLGHLAARASTFAVMLSPTGDAREDGQ
jgi:hypothetical protein